MSEAAVTIHHDSLFKWLLKAFMPDFFAHYFPEVAVRKVRMLDKEFLKKLESFKASLEADLLIALEVQIEDQWHSVVVCLEHKSWRTEVAMTVMEYAAYAWLAEKRPVWSIVFFTDEGNWTENISDRAWLGFSRAGGQMMYIYDIIKVNRERSLDLIAKRSLFLSLLALRANRQSVEHAEIVAAVYRDAAHLSDQLTNDHKLLIEQMVEAYSKLPPGIVEEIKERQNMRFVADTITEHYEHIGELRGKQRELCNQIRLGREQLELLASMLSEGSLTKKLYARMAQPWNERIAAAEVQLQALELEKRGV